MPELATGNDRLLGEEQSARHLVLGEKEMNMKPWLSWTCAALSVAALGCGGTPNEPSSTVGQDLGFSEGGRPEWDGASPGPFALDGGIPIPHFDGGFPKPKFDAGPFLVPPDGGCHAFPPFFLPDGGFPEPNLPFPVSDGGFPPLEFPDGGFHFAYDHFDGAPPFPPPELDGGFPFELLDGGFPFPMEGEHDGGKPW